MRRAAFYNVGNINIFAAVKINGVQIAVQQLAAAPHKGQALFVLLCAGALADKQHLGIRHALAKHHMAALGTKGASAALQAIGLQLGNIHNEHSPKII